jgi:hypothetical protein
VIAGQFAGNAVAVEMDPSCMRSFNVQDTTLISGGNTMSCRELENRRVVLFTEVNGLPTSGNINMAPYAKKLASIEAKLGEIEADHDWTSVGLTVSGSFLATLGLAACAETAGGGCALAAIGKALTVVGIAKSAVSDAKKASAVRDLKSEVAAVRTQIQARTPAVVPLRERLITEFNGLCADVKKSCLAK